MEHYDPKTHGRILSNDRKHMKIILWLGLFLVVLGIGTCILTFFEFEDEPAPNWMLFMGLGIITLGGLVILLHFNILKRGKKEQANIDNASNIMKVTQGTIIRAITVENPGVLNDVIKAISIGYEFTDDTSTVRKGANVINIENMTIIFPFLLEQREVIQWPRMLKGQPMTLAFNAKKSFPLIKDFADNN